MTEEIIIDGVDVTGCEYYYRCDCKIDDDTDINLCKWHDDCYYKQLKRLEQENKELKEKVKELDKMTGIFSARLCNNYRSALEEIREVIYYCGHKDVVDKVLPKINEVL